MSLCQPQLVHVDEDFLLIIFKKLIGSFFETKQVRKKEYHSK